MDTLDKVGAAAADTDKSLRYEDATIDQAMADADELDTEDTPVVVQKSRFWTFLAAGAIVGVAAAAGYAFWRAQQQTPKSRFERFKSRLGLDHLDMTSVPAAIRSVDYDKLNRARRDAGIYARQKVHVGAKKVAELTR